MELFEVRSFLVVAEAGSLSRASLTSGIPQATLSRHLAKLEADLGGALFYRDGRGVRLTEIGAQFLSQIAPLVDQFELVRASIASEAQSVSGTVRLGVVPAVAQSIGARIALAYSQANPGVELELLEASSRTLAQWLDAAQIDVSILYDTRQAPNASLSPVLEEELQLVCTPDSLEGRGRGPIPLSGLDPKRLILPSSRAQAFRLAIETCFKHSGVEMRAGWRINSVAVTKRMIAAGNLMSILPQGAVAQDVAERRLVTRPIASEHPPLAVMVVGTATSKPISRAARGLVRLIPQVIDAALTEGVLIGRPRKMQAGGAKA